MRPYISDKRPHGKMPLISGLKAEWTGGFWQSRFQVCRETMIPHMKNLLEDPDVSHCWTNFLIAAGYEEGEHSGPPFHDGDFYKWLEGASYMAGETGDDALIGELDEYIRIIREVQQEDGFIFTMQAIEARKNPDVKPLADDLNFEVYNLGHLMTAGCVHYRATGKISLLEAAEKAAEYLDNRFRLLNDMRPRTAICPSHYMGLADLYRTTGKGKYIDLLERLIVLRDQVEGGTDDNQDRIPLKEQREIIGHAVRANYLYAGLADLYMEKGDGDYRTVLEAVWDDLVRHKLYITGSCGALYDGVSPYGCDDYFYIQRTHQTYGRKFELPNLAGYNETCAAIGNYLWNGRMLQAFGDGKYADMMERALYNGILSGINLKGDRYFYTNALRRLREIPFDWKWSRRRERYITSFCCPPNLVRTIAETTGWLCFAREGGLALPFYGNFRASFAWPDGTESVWSMETNFPWDGIISVTLEDPGREDSFPLFLRIPSWTDAYDIAINGDSWEDYSEKQGYVGIRREWKKGDRLECRFTMPVRLYESHPLVEENRNHVAVQRGPIVYCLESADLPEGTDIMNVSLSPDEKWIPEPGTVDGEDIIILKGTGFLREDSGWKEKPLYREYRRRELKPVPLTLIPYFAWDNRGDRDMTVWLPLSRR